MSDTKTLQDVTVESDVRYARQLVAEITAKNKELQAAKARLVASIGIGNAVDVDGRTARVKQATVQVPPALLTLESVASRRMFQLLTTRVVDMGAVQARRKLGRMPAEIEALFTERDNAPYVDGV